MDGERTSIVNRAVLMAGLLILPACATNGAMEELRAQVNHSLSQTRQQMLSRLSTLEETKKKLAAQEKQLTEALNAKHGQESRLDTLEFAINRSLEQQRVFSEDLAKVRMGMQEKGDRLLLLLDAQEALYQDGLRTLQAIRGQLSGKQNQMIQPRSQADESNGALAPLLDRIEKNDFSRPGYR